MSIDRERYQKFCERLGLREQPLGVFYSAQRPANAVSLQDEKGHVCIFALLKRARQRGETVSFDEGHVGCDGGAYYLGFRPVTRPKIEYFLSCGIPGEMEGERYIKTPELAREFFNSVKPRPAPGRYCIFKPLDRLAPGEKPEVVVFFATPDVLSGLFTLTNYTAERMDAVYSPFSSGCGAILTHPLKEGEREKPRGVLGLFDVSARPLVEAEVLTFAVPIKLFHALLDNMDESFLITESWKRVRERTGWKT